MKQSLIIILIICFVLGESFSFIVKRDNKKENTTNYCCNKVCDKSKASKKSTAAEQPYLPVVNWMGYSL